MDIGFQAMGGKVACPDGTHMGNPVMGREGYHGMAVKAMTMFDAGFAVAVSAARVGK